MKKIGITGSIGAGKSIVSKFLKTMHYPVYDSDYWAKYLMNNNAVIRHALSSRFGENTYTNIGLNKAFLAEQIFNNKDNLAFVNSIVHPTVGQHFLQWAESQQSELIFIESAILFSSGFNKIVNDIIFVDAPQQIRLQRAMIRDNATNEAIMARIQNQIIEENIARQNSNYIIYNDNQTLIIPQILSILNSING